MMEPTAPQAEPADLSSRTVTTLVIVTLIVSLLGAWMNIHQATSLAPADVASGGGPVHAMNARIVFDVSPPPVTHDTATGLVAFRIEQPPARA